MHHVPFSEMTLGDHQPISMVEMPMSGLPQHCNPGELDLRDFNMHQSAHGQNNWLQQIAHSSNSKSAALQVGDYKLNSTMAGRRINTSTN